MQFACTTTKSKKETEPRKRMVKIYIFKGDARKKGKGRKNERGLSK
jgi:hypothetical protein